MGNFQSCQFICSSLNWAHCETIFFLSFVKTESMWCHFWPWANFKTKTFWMIKNESPISKRPLLIPHSLVFNNPNFLCFFSHREKAAEEKLILADNFFLLILLRITHPWYITGGGLYTMHVIQPFICKMRQTARYLHKWKDDASLRKKKNIPRRGYAIRL